MKNRVVGAIGFLIILYGSIFLHIFEYLGILFLIFGFYEFYKITRKKITVYSVLYIIIYTIGVLSLTIISNESPNIGYPFILVSTIMVFDTFAFLVGRKYGKSKVTKISPNKTFEGILGGTIGGIVVFFVYLLLSEPILGIAKLNNYSFLINIILVLNICLLAFLGDILESKLKRIHKIKDSGTIVYGHGGILDRIDSWILPAIYLGLVLSTTKIFNILIYSMILLFFLVIGLFILKKR